MDKIEPGVTAYFDASRSSTYDRKIRAGIPAYESLHDMSNLLIRSVLPQQASILVVGAGTGMELVTLGLANPEWTFTAVEPSSDMLSICMSNVHSAGIAKRVEIVSGNLDALGVGKRFHAATSILVSHFIKDWDSRVAFFRSIAEHIVDDGVLVTADIAADTSDFSFDVFVTAWKAHYGKLGISSEEVDTECNRSLNTVSVLREEELLRILADAGFRSIHQFYRAFLFSGWLCFKSSDGRIAPNQAL